jgi:hypothetical protein
VLQERNRTHSNRVMKYCERRALATIAALIGVQYRYPGFLVIDFEKAGKCGRGSSAAPRAATYYYESKEPPRSLKEQVEDELPWPSELPRARLLSRFSNKGK